MRGRPGRFPTLIHLLVAFIAIGLGGAMTSAQDASPSGVVEGRVLDTTTGRYVEGADVSISGTELRATTERDGTFTIRGVPAGQQVVVVNYIGLDTANEPVTVVAGAVASVSVKLTSEVITLSEMKVTSVREGMAEAVALQKASVQAKVVAASDQFGPISEGNIGEYLKFMPGVSIDYNVNDARGISLRGLSTSFTIVAVDGTPMAGASSTDDTRRFEFEQIAMNNVETTELFKTVTPDIPATATGGFVNFVTKSSFDFAERQRITYDLSFSAPSSNASFDKKRGLWGDRKQYTIRPNLELNYGRKITDKLGFNLNYRLSEKYDDSPRTEITWDTTAKAPTVMSAPKLRQYNIRQEEKLTHREAFAAKLDYHMSDQTKVMLSGQWNWYDLDFTQRGPQFVLGTSTTPDGMSFTSASSGASIQNGVLYREKYGTTMHFNGKISHQFDNRSTLELEPYWSRADSKYRDTNKGFISSSATLAPGSSTYTSFTLNNPWVFGVLPSITINKGTSTLPLDYVRDLANYTLSNTTGTNFQSRNWTAIDYKNGARADYSIPFDDLRIPLTIQVGGELDKTHRSISRPDLRGNIPTTTGTALTALMDPGFTRDVAYGFGSIQALDPYKVWEAFSSRPVTVAAYDQRDIRESNSAVYLRGDFKATRDLLIITGVRWERRTIDARAKTGAPARARETLAKLSFDDYYPSLSIKYTPKRSIVLRAGVSRTVGLPDYGEMLPTFVTPNTSGGSDGTISVPSSNLKPYRVTNFDLSADYYLKNSGVLSLSLYRKNVNDFIISRTMTADERLQVLADYGLNAADFGATSGTIRENGAKSRLQGYEISYAQNLSSLPKPFNGLSVQANFTYTDVDAFDADPYRALDTMYSQLRAVSPKTANFILGYRYGSFNAAITTNWVSPSLYGGFVNTNYVTGSANTSNPALDTRLALYKDEKTTTDVKVEYAFTKQISVYFLVRNVFNTPRKEYFRGYLPQYQNVVLPMRYFEFGEPHLTLGVRGTF